MQIFVKFGLLWTQEFVPKYNHLSNIDENKIGREGIRHLSKGEWKMLV